MRFYLDYRGYRYYITCDNNFKGADVREAFCKALLLRLDEYLLVYDNKVLQNDQNIDAIEDGTYFRLVKKEIFFVNESGKEVTVNITLDAEGEITVKDLRAAVEAASPDSKVARFNFKYTKVIDDNAKVSWIDIYQPYSDHTTLYIAFKSPVEITFVNEKGEKIKVNLDENSSVGDARKTIAKAVNIPVDELKLMYYIAESGLGKKIEEDTLILHLKNSNIAAVKKEQQVLFVDIIYEGKGNLVPFVFNPDESIVDIKTRMNQLLLGMDLNSVALKLIYRGYHLADDITAQNRSLGSIKDGSMVQLCITQKEIEASKTATPSPVLTAQTQSQKEKRESSDKLTASNESCFRNAAVIGCVTTGICMLASHRVRLFTGADRIPPKVSVPASLLIGALAGIIAYKCQYDGQSGAQRA